MKPEAGFFSRHAGFFPAMGLIVLAAFFFARAFASGIQVADDAYFASIAKNIAFGLGYGTTVVGKGFILFDYLIGTGPMKSSMQNPVVRRGASVGIQKICGFSSCLASAKAAAY